MDNPLIPDAQDRLVEEALQTYPLAPMPQDMTPGVMTRIRTLPAPRPFGLTWGDLALAALLSLCVAAIWLSVQNLPPVVLAQLRKEWILFQHYLMVNARWLLPAVSFGTAAFLAALAFPYLLQELKRGSA